MRGKRYCEDDQGIERAEELKRRRVHDDRRASARDRGYDWTWEKARAAVLMKHPLCEVCMSDGRARAATLVHHVDENSSNNVDANLRALCRDCHEVTHGRKRR